MPKVKIGGKIRHFSYTKKGKKAAKKFSKKRDAGIGLY